MMTQGSAASIPDCQQSSGREWKNSDDQVSFRTNDSSRVQETQNVDFGRIYAIRKDCMNSRNQTSRSVVILRLL